ncbi:MAG: acyl-CoA-binding protein [Gammaproteobacteria bacterium]|nr:acyl-CoA-binding protein [Gammaproteobacteria bacterium]NNC98114.1 acyl-CoA-binding protein [Gammaproteobacteria bacterium]NNM13178.1 acyl-CoA-binding protein [Gammaproteobacteria bacterium]
MSDLEELFSRAQDEAYQLSERPSNKNMLKMYGLFKQATVGDAIGKRPGILDVKGRAKYDAWYGYCGMQGNNAKQAYIDLVNELKQG